ncbi:MAG TPA: DUF4912 domain-containing protein [Polyangia bacterium]|jgi:hypothetical protein|nr:DUF4912 domain-containing protein [Polyangia bacterium]
MSEETTQTPSSEHAGLTVVAAQILSAVSQHDGASPSTASSVENFLRCTRDQLLGFAKRLGVGGTSKLSKAELAARLHGLLAALPRTAGGESTKDQDKDKIAGESSGDGGGFPPKYDLGPDAEELQMPRHIPWGYGQDRVTAMVVDPDRLFVYWEVTDAAMESGRRALGKGGADAWLCLRVYDTTGRLFDGTNAHSYFDHNIGRGDRQWFFDINKPTSAACVEVGLKSTEGFFVKVARSGRVEFPRSQPVGGGHVEWMTVTNAAGAPGPSTPGTLPTGPAAAPGHGPGGGDGTAQAAAAPGGGGAGHGGVVESIATGFTEHQTERHWEWREGEQASWQTELASISWTEPVIRSTWEAGPFTYPVQSPVLTEEHHGAQGHLHYRTENGRVHITYGPWQVVIRGLGARAERRVLATWQVTHSWSTVAARESTPVTWRPVGPGASEWMAEGGSERVWMSGSELRLGGGSEMFMLGASELRLFGASERLLSGASEYRFRGASERLLSGASEYQFRGASERLGAGASESLFRGASERALGGASERVIGASEQHLGYPAAIALANGTDGEGG